MTSTTHNFSVSDERVIYHDSYRVNKNRMFIFLLMKQWWLRRKGHPSDEKHPQNYSKQDFTDQLPYFW